jgi:hypothetical protein
VIRERIVLEPRKGEGNSMAQGRTDREETIRRKIVNTGEKGS